MQRRSGELTAQGVPESLADRVAEFTEVYSSFDIIEVARATSIPVDSVAAAYFALGAELDLNWLRDQVAALPRVNRWQALARAALRDDLYSLESALTGNVLDMPSSSREPQSRIRIWAESQALSVSRWRQVLADLKAAGSIDFTMLSVALGELRGLQRAALPGSTPAKRPAKGSRKRRAAG